MKNIPNKIYLQIGEDCEDCEDFNELSELTWCKDKIFKNDIEFIIKNPEREIDVKALAKIIAEYCNKNSLLYDGCKNLAQHLKSTSHLWIKEKEKG